LYVPRALSGSRPRPRLRPWPQPRPRPAPAAQPPATARAIWATCSPLPASPRSLWPLPSPRIDDAASSGGSPTGSGPDPRRTGAYLGAGSDSATARPSSVTAHSSRGLALRAGSRHVQGRRFRDLPCI